MAPDLCATASDQRPRLIKGPVATLPALSPQLLLGLEEKSNAKELIEE